MRNLLVISTAFLVVTLHWGCGWAEEEPPLFPVSDCEKVRAGRLGEDCPAHEYRIKGESESPIIRLSCGSPRLPTYLVHPVFAEINHANGDRIAGPVVISGNCFINKVVHADLNGDGREDFVVSLYIDHIFSDNQFFREALVLSVGESYEVTVMNTKFEGTRFVDLRGDGTAQIIDRMLVFGDEVGDDVERFYVDNVYEFQGGRIVEANHLLPGYPKWSVVNRKTGEHPPANLAQEKKDRLWEEYERHVFWEVDDEYQRILRWYWKTVLKELDKAAEEDLSSEEKTERLHDLLKDAHERILLESMSTQEKEALKGADGAITIEDIRKVFGDSETAGKNLLEVLEEIVNFDNQSEQDRLFLHRLLKYGTERAAKEGER